VSSDSSQGDRRKRGGRKERARPGTATRLRAPIALFLPGDALALTREPTTLAPMDAPALRTAVADFLASFTHEVLYQRGLYASDIFERR